MFRPSIPKKLRRAIYEEAGYRCGIPTCQNVKPLIIHHIIPWKIVQKHEKHNLICLCRNCHDFADNEVIPRESIIRYKKRLQMLNSKYEKFEMKVLNRLYKKDTVILPEDLLLFIEDIISDNLVIKEKIGRSKRYRIHLTEGGATFIELES